MLLIAKFLANIFSILNSEISPRQIAAGFAMGVLVGLLPVSGLLPYVILFLCFLVNINLAMMGLATAVFKLLAFAFDPLTNVIGFHLLAKTPSLNPLWTRLYNMPVVPYTRFNNTIVMGSFVLGVLLIVPMYLLCAHGVAAYRSRWREAVLRWKIVQVIKASNFYKYYQTYRDIRGR